MLLIPAVVLLVVRPYRAGGGGIESLTLGVALPALAPPLLCIARYSLASPFGSNHGSRFEQAQDHVRQHAPRRRHGLCDPLRNGALAVLPKRVHAHARRVDGGICGSPLTPRLPLGSPLAPL